MAPTVQKAVIIQQDRSVALREIAVPKPGPDEILVKVVAAAQNPVDCECGGFSLCAFVQLIVFLVLSGKTALYGKRAGVVSGCDFSGIVEEIGSNVPHGLRSVGERIAGLVHGGRSSHLTQ
jgi:NADPH:quinone reductase-like Zn-dependent oxidoreductase